MIWFIQCDYEYFYAKNIYQSIKGTARGFFCGMWSELTAETHTLRMVKMTILSY